MDASVFIAVLFAAACHAGWNAAIKGGAEPFSTTAAIAIGAGTVAVPFVFLLGIPRVDAWPWLAASIVFNFGYYTALAAAYKNGDMGLVYPIARGAAPLLIALASVLLLGERLSN